MKTLLIIFISLILLVFIVPLAWVLIQEVIFFFGHLLGSSNIASAGFCLLCVVAIIIFICIIVN